MTADQITQPGQVYAPPAAADNTQTDSGARRAANMISSPGNAARQRSHPTSGQIHQQPTPPP
ncbi:MAG: hypothetical protein R2911_07710 [Caldilineaceae bacterium]